VVKKTMDDAVLVQNDLLVVHLVECRHSVIPWVVSQMLHCCRRLSRNSRRLQYFPLCRHQLPLLHMDPTDAVVDETQKKLNHLKWYHQLHLSAMYLLLKMEKRRTWRHQQAEPLLLLSAGEPRYRERLRLGGI
jgi:hypothetical protein